MEGGTLRIGITRNMESKTRSALAASAKLS